MSDKISDSITEQIERSKKEVTVVFTDIVRSTDFWAKYGDTAGRLMVDRHNKLMFPVVKSFRGKVLKTIGDSIMASFKSPEDAISAAIAMQQVMQETQKDESPENKIRIRVGVHTGEAILEKGDVYGDVVNVASRVTGRALAGEALVSAATVKRLQGRRLKDYLKRKKSFVPKGKRRPLVVYACNWKEHDSLLDMVKIRTRLPVPTRQKFELLVYVLTVIAAGMVMWTYMIRYFLVDIEFVAVYIFNPHPLLTASVIAVAVTLGVVLILKVETVSPVWMKLMKGGFGFGIGFVVLFTAAHLAQLELGRYWEGAIHESEHIMVEVLADGVAVYKNPSDDYKPLFRADEGSLYLLNKRVTRRGREWTKVLLGKGKHKYGYIQKILPARVGVEEQRQTMASKFRFRFYDLYALLLGLIGFNWGFFSFRIRPM